MTDTGVLIRFVLVARGARGLDARFDARFDAVPWGVLAGKPITTRRECDRTT